LVAPVRDADPVGRGIQGISLEGLLKARSNCPLGRQRLLPNLLFPRLGLSPTLGRGMNQAVFLDRDGTVIEEKHYLHRPEEVVLFPGAGEALARLQKAGFKLIIVTNQSGVGRGYFTLAEVESVHQRLTGDLEPFGVKFDRFYIAPEAPKEPSRGRKPSPQFLLDAKTEFDLDLGRCYMIGDKLIDLECGWNAGVKASILVRTGYGAKAELEMADKVKLAVVVEDLSAAANWILNQE
jgi:D-glycero-D-manno-heptose 1,7-bisphosphate phosphatase